MILFSSNNGANNGLDLTSIRSLLVLIITSMSATDICTDSSIVTMVKDAKKVLHDVSSIYTIDRKMFDFTLYLQQHGNSIIASMDPDKLNKQDCELLLTIFE